MNWSIRSLVTESSDHTCLGVIRDSLAAAIVFSPVAIALLLRIANVW